MAHSLVAINPDQLLPSQRLYAKVLELEFGECRYLHYGLGDERSPIGDLGSAESVLAMQQRFNTCLGEQVDAAIAGEVKVLVVGPSLGDLAESIASRGIETVWISTAITANEEADYPVNLRRLNSDLLTAEPGMNFDVIVIEGSYHYLDQLPILNKCREAIRGGGALFIFGEFLDDDSLIERSPLPNLSSFRQLSDRLGYEIVSEEDLTIASQSSLVGFTALVRRQRTALSEQAGISADQLAEFEAQLQQTNQEFSNGRRCFRLFRLNKVANPTGEYVNAEYGDIHSFQPAEVADLFEKSFDVKFDPELWRWKYELGDGKCVIARQHRGSEIVSHYGGAPRQIYYFGELSMAIQPCDVMVLPEIRKHYGKSSLFFKTAATFLEREIGNTVNQLLGFGFPNQPTMNIAIRLGLYEKTDDYVEVVFPASPPKLDSSVSTWNDVDGSDPVHQQDVENLWEQMRADFREGVIGMRHWQYIKYRYFDHPFGARGLYRCLALRTGEGTAAQAIAVLKAHGDRQLVMDLICPMASIKTVLAQLNQLVTEEQTGAGLKLWITRAWVKRIKLDGAIVNELGIEIPCNSWNPGPSSRTLYGAWWLTAGDMDFV